MSVSVTAAPFLLMYALGNVISATGAIVAAVTAAQVSGTVLSGLSNTSAKKLHLEDNTLEEQFFNKEFPTVIMDKQALLKTLEEHGATNFQTEGGQISCNCEAFHLTFTKKEKDKPYTMVATYNKDYGLNELVENLGSEYASNAQEISYNKIKERLEKQNLEIEEEEVFDDNTIVLTVNLE